LKPIPVYIPIDALNRVLKKSSLVLAFVAPVGQAAGIGTVGEVVGARGVSATVGHVDDVEPGGLDPR
jgi:hypothetical protein